jgi:hypothetical protein
MTTQCPKSLITGESLRFLEVYRVWKRLGKGCTMSLEARCVEAIELLEQEWIAENERENK